MAYNTASLNIGYYSAMEFAMEAGMYPKQYIVLQKLKSQMSTLERQCGVIDGLFPRTNEALFGNCEYETYKELASQLLQESNELLAA